MKPKVYGMNYNGRERRIVAATSWAKAAAAAGMSLSDARSFGSITGNKEECERCLREPGVVWSRPVTGFHADWKRVS